MNEDGLGAMVGAVDMQTMFREQICPPQTTTMLLSGSILTSVVILTSVGRIGKGNCLALLVVILYHWTRPKTDRSRSRSTSNQFLHEAWGQA